MELMPIGRRTAELYGDTTEANEVWTPHTPRRGDRELPYSR